MLKYILTLNRRPVWVEALEVIVDADDYETALEWALRWAQENYEESKEFHPLKKYNFEVDESHVTVLDSEDYWAPTIE